MRVHELLRRRIRAAIDGVDYAGDVNLAIAANVEESSQTTFVSSRNAAETSTRRDAGQHDAMRKGDAT